MKIINKTEEYMLYYEQFLSLRDQGKLKEQLAQLSKGVGVIYIGAATVNFASVSHLDSSRLKAYVCL